MATVIYRFIVHKYKAERGIHPVLIVWRQD